MTASPLGSAGVATGVPTKIINGEKHSPPIADSWSDPMEQGECAMPLSRPSRAAPPPPQLRPGHKQYKEWTRDYDNEEAAAVDRKLAQLAKARKKAAPALARKRQEDYERKWAWLRVALTLSRRQELLLRACDGKVHDLPAAVELVYPARWARLGKKQRRKYLSRLRTLQHAINRKLADKGRKERISIQEGRIRIVSGRRWKKRVCAERIKQFTPASHRSRESVMLSAEAWLRHLFRMDDLLEDGWLPVNVLNETGRLAGFRRSTIRNARRRLNLERKRVGYGDQGKWLVCLPTPRKTAKT